MKFDRYKNFFSSNFAEYFYYFIGLSMLVTTILVGSLYYYSASVLRQEAITSNNNSLVLLRNAQELVLSEVDKSMGNIFLDSFYASYMDYYYRQDMVTLQKLQNKLDDVLSTSDYIESAYIYYIQDGFVLSSRQGPVRMEDFADKTFAEQLVSNAVPKNYVKARMVPKNLAGEQSVITIVKAIPIYYSTMLPTAYVVVNIKGIYLEQVVNSIKTNEDASILVADDSGSIITQKAGANSIVRNASEFMLIPAAKSFDTYEKRIDGNDTLVSYVTSEKYGWTYIYTVPMSVVTQKIQHWVQTALLVSIFVIMISMLCSLLFTKRISAPLKRMLSILRNENPAEEKQSVRKVKEVMQIERGVSRILDQKRSLELLKGEYEAFSKNKFLSSLLSSDEATDPKIKENLDYYNLDLDRDGYFAACLLSMDEYAKYSQEHSEKGRNSLFLLIMEDLVSGVLEECKGFIVEADTNQIALVLNFGGPASLDEARTRSSGIAKRIHGLIRQKHSYSFTLGVGTPYKGIGHIRESYYEAGIAINYRLILGNDNVILFENLEKGEKHIPYPMSIERNLLNGLKTGDPEVVSHYLAEFETYIQRNATDHIETVRSFFLQLFSSTIKCIYEMDSDFELGSLIQNVKHTDLLNEETIRGMVTYMNRIYDQILAYLETKRSQKNKELITALKDYILQHLADDLTLERLSEQFYISASYLRKIYKDETGETIKDFILSERMRRAKELLNNTSINIADIAEQVGYMSSQSFSKAFKLETGKTPAAFREEQQRRPIQ
jgi:two-component system, response regulator YesN